MSMSVTVSLRYVECWVCSTPFAYPESLHHAVKRDNGTLFCPRGCRLGLGESDEQKLKRQLDAKQRELDFALQRELRARANADAAEKKARRFKCLHCKRDFATSAKVLEHQRKIHQAPLRLPKDAGPTANNTDVSNKQN